MKKINIILLSLILFFIAISFYSIEILSQKVNIYLINTIRFLLTSSLLFLIFEKRILLNIKHTYKQSIVVGFILTIYALSITYAIYLSNFVYAIVFLIIPLLLFLVKKKVLNYTIVSIIIILTLIAFKNSSDLKLLSLPFFVLSSISIYTMLYVFSKYKDTFDKYKITSYFVFTLIPTIVSIVMFFITKPIKAPMLSTTEQIHLIMLILNTIIPVFLLLITKIYHNVYSIYTLSFLTIILGLLLLPFSIITIIIAIIILIPLFNVPKKTTRGFAFLEIISVITLLLIIASLIIPFYKEFNIRKQLKNDIISIQNNEYNNSLTSIGKIFIKVYEERIVYIIDRQQNKTIVCPIQ